MFPFPMSGIAWVWQDTRFGEIIIGMDLGGYKNGKTDLLCLNSL